MTQDNLYLFEKELTSNSKRRSKEEKDNFISLLQKNINFIIEEYDDIYRNHKYLGLYKSKNLIFGDINSSK